MWHPKLADLPVRFFKNSCKEEGISRVDVRFRFKPGAQIVAARRVHVHSIDQEFWDRIVEWQEATPLEESKDLPDEYVHAPNTGPNTLAILAEKQPTPVHKHPHYFKDVRKLDYIDVYRVLNMFGEPDAPIAHAIKKLLVPGARGAKPKEQDIREAIDSLNRWLEMRREDEGRCEANTK